MVSFKGPILVMQWEVSVNPAYLNSPVSLKLQVPIFHFLPASPSLTTTLLATDLFVPYQSLVPGESRKPAFFVGDHCSKHLEQKSQVLSWFITLSRLPLKNCVSHFLSNLYHKYGIYCYFSSLRYALLYWPFQVQLRLHLFCKERLFRVICAKILHPLENTMENCGPHLFVLTFQTKIIGVCMKLGAKHLFRFCGIRQERPSEALKNSRWH